MEPGVPLDQMLARAVGGRGSFYLCPVTRLCNTEIIRGYETYSGLRVLGTDFVAHYKDGQCTRINGTVLRTSTERDNSGMVPEEDACQYALQCTNTQGATRDCTVGRVALIYHVRSDDIDYPELELLWSIHIMDAHGTHIMSMHISADTPNRLVNMSRPWPPCA